MMESAEQQREEILSEAKETEQSIKEDISADVSRTLGEFEAQQKESTEAELQKISSDKQSAIDRLSSIYEKNHDTWEEQIFSNIIGME